MVVRARTRGTRSGRPRLRLQHQLIILLAVFSLVPLFATNLWGYLQSRRYLTNAAFRNVENVAALEAAKTSRFALGKRDLVASVANALGSELSRHESSTGSWIRALLEHDAAHTRTALELVMLSSDARAVASSSPERRLGSDLSTSPCWVGGRSVARPVGFEYPRGEHVLLVAAPIRAPSGELFGVLCGRFMFEMQQEMVVARTERTPNADVYLLDPHGQLLCGSFDASHGQMFGAPLERGNRPPVGGPEPWQDRYTLPSRGAMIGAYAPVKEFGWGVLVETPVASALASIDRLKRQSAEFGLALAAGLMLVVFLTARAVTRPLDALAAAVSRMKKGARGEHVPLAGPVEVAALAASFNEMSRALKDSHELLESRIDERTQELLRSREFAELLLHSIDEPVVVLGPDLRVVQANRTAIHLFGEDLVGSSCDEALGGPARSGAECPAREAFETGQVVVAERSRPIGGQQEILHLRFFPVSRPDGRIEAVVSVGRLVTREKQLQAQMMHQEKMAAFGLLAAGVAHEIGNPLAAVLSQLRRARESEGLVLVTLDIVEREVQRISKLLHELVDLSRRRRSEVVLVSLNQQVQDVARLLAHDPRARNVRFEQHLASHMPGVRAAEDPIVQVLLNLGLNALDAMPDGGTLAFETAVLDGLAVARVRDSGHGLSAEARQRLFEPFFTTKGLGKGTGLGLFVSKGIVEGLGGTLWLESAGPDGTVFAVAFPLSDVQEQLE